jgi:D-alanine-D-alanine ligase
MKICVLQSSYEDSNSPFKNHDPYADVAQWMPEHTVERQLIRKSIAVQQIRDLAKQGFDVFINLCDGGFDEDRAGLEVVQALERYNVPFTGASSSFYEPSKEHMKMAANYCGVRTPAFVFAYDDNDIESAVNLTFPLIVKHYNGCGSVGMTRNSRCETRDQLFEQARKMIAEFGGALIEEFVEGREFTVLVAENPADEANPFAFMPVECIFAKGETFKHFDLKWIEHTTLNWIPCADEVLGQKLIELSKKIFVGLHGVSYGRTDIRVNKDNEPYFLEINPNCGIFYPKEDAGSADFILFNDPNMGHKAFLDHIIKCALKRHRNKNAKFEVRWFKNTGYGLYAKQAIKEGEVIEKYEEKPQHLVTKTEVSTWVDPIKKAWFDRCAYPISDEVWLIWGENPMEWRPINHSCDPTAWFSGLDIVARRDLKKNEQITLDYATYCGENMASFTCHCRSVGCRTTISGTDYQQPWVLKQYGNHVSPYVKSKSKTN